MKKPIDSGDGDSSGGAQSHGWAETQGVRPSMEDGMIRGEHLVQNFFLWAVLDGHSGRASVERLVAWLPAALRDGLSACGARPETDEEMHRVIVTAVEATDRKLLAAQEAVGFDDGATALLVLADGDAWECRKFYVAQVGDSQVVLCSAFGADALATQHRTDEPDEAARLEAAGAKVQDDRVIGLTRSLAVTRAMGDRDVKAGGGLIATPAVTTHDVSAADELLILGCDGLWDVMAPEEAWSLAKRKGKSRGAWDLQKAARALVEGALNAQTGDNVSVLVLSLRPPKGERPPPKCRPPPKLKPDALSITIGANGRLQSVALSAKGLLATPGWRAAPRLATMARTAGAFRAPPSRPAPALVRP